MARPSDAILIEETVSVAWGHQVFNGCYGIVFLRLPIASRALPSSVGSWRVPPRLGCSSVTAVAISTWIGCCNLIRVHEESIQVVILALLAEPRILLVIIVVECVASRSLDGIFTIGPVVD